MRTILLYSGWQTANIGDIGHTTGTVRYLTQHIPDARLTVCVCRSNPAILAMLQRRFPTAEFFGSSFDSQAARPRPNCRRHLKSARCSSRIRGMIYNRFWHASPRIVDLCAQHGKALCIYGQSFDGFPEETEAEWASDWPTSI